MNGLSTGFLPQVEVTAAVNAERTPGEATEESSSADGFATLLEVVGTALSALKSATQPVAADRSSGAEGDAPTAPDMIPPDEAASAPDGLWALPGLGLSGGESPFRLFAPLAPQPAGQDAERRLPISPADPPRLHSTRVVLDEVPPADDGAVSPPVDTVLTSAPPTRPPVASPSAEPGGDPLDAAAPQAIRELDLLSGREGNSIDGADGPLAEMAQRLIRDRPAVLRSEPEPVFSLPRSIHHPDWAADVGERLVWMQRADLKTAHLRLDPPQLGEIEVHITLREAGTEIWFSTASATVREALETALPRLREMFSQNGLQLDQAGVYSGGGGGESPAFARSPQPSRRLLQAHTAEPVAPVALSRPHGGLFEAYA